MREQFCMVVENEPNVLLRVFRLLARHGLNVDELTVKKTPDRSQLEITLTAEEENISSHVENMLNRLVDVVAIHRELDGVWQKS